MDPGPRLVYLTARSTGTLSRYALPVTLSGGRRAVLVTIASWAALEVESRWFGAPSILVIDLDRLEQAARRPWPSSFLAMSTSIIVVASEPEQTSEFLGATARVISSSSDMMPLLRQIAGVTASPTAFTREGGASSRR